MKTPNLFPNITTLTGYENKRSYVEEVIVDLAQRGDLFLTYLLRQGYDALVSGVILGHRINAETNRIDTDAMVHPLIEAYQVKIASFDGGPFQFKMGKRPSREQYTSPRKATSSAIRLEDRIIRVPSSPYAMPLRYALFCLKERGEWVAAAPSASSRKQRWTVRELPPASVKVDVLSTVFEPETIAVGHALGDGAQASEFDVSDQAFEGIPEAPIDERKRTRTKGRERAAEDLI